MTKFNRDDVGIEIQLKGINELSGLVEQYGPQRVWDAVAAVHGFHPRLITSFNEAAKVAEHLATTTEKGI